MSFLDCIDTAIATGRVKKAKGEQAKRIWQEAYDEAIFLGKTERTAADTASLKSVERIAADNWGKKWQKVNEIRVAHAIFEEFSKTRTPVEGIIRLGDKIDVATMRIANQAMALFELNLEKWRPRAAGLIHPTKNMDDVVRAAYGETVQDASARELATEIANVNEFLRKRANMEGALILENKNRRLPQQQDRHRLIKQRKELGVEAARAEWIQEHMDGLDWEMMRYHDKEIPVHKREEILNRTYDSILTQGNSRLKPGKAGSEGLAERMSRERFFYYKDADTWLRMQEKYGAGNVFLQMVSGIEVMARDIATLEHLGPNPLQMKNYLGNVAKKRAADIDIAESGRRSMVSKVQKEFETFEERYRIHNHLVSNGDESLTTQVLATTRTAVMGAILTKAFLANLGDLGFGKHTALINKIPAAGLIREVLANFAGMPSKQRRVEAVRAGLGFESAINMALAMQRYLGPLDGAHWAKRVADVSFRTTWLTPLTQASRWAWGHHLMGALADNAKVAFDDVPFVESMREAGITAQEWDQFRATPLHDIGGAPALRPLDLLQRTDLDSQVRQKLSDKFMDWILDTGRRAVPSVDTRVQAALGGGIDADTARGQVMRTFGAVKSFPTVIMMLHLRDAMAAPTVGGKLGNIARFTLMLTLAGAAITQMKEVVAGRDPRDMTQGTFWLRALLNGGSLGFAGDALFNNLNAYRGGGLQDAFAGPIVDFASDTRDLTIGNMLEFLEGKDTKGAKELVDFGSRYTPIPWQARLMLERAILEDLMKAADPRAHRRLKEREARRIRNLKQRSWWPSGERTPRRLPNPAAVIGGG